MWLQQCCSLVLQRHQTFAGGNGKLFAKCSAPSSCQSVLSTQVTPHVSQERRVWEGAWNSCIWLHIFGAQAHRMTVLVVRKDRVSYLAHEVAPVLRLALCMDLMSRAGS